MPSRGMNPSFAWAGASSTKVEHEFGSKPGSSTITPGITTANPRCAISCSPSSATQGSGRSPTKTGFTDYEPGLRGEVLEGEGLQRGLRRAVQKRLFGFHSHAHQDQKTNPEVFYWVAYAGDTTLIMKQAKELDFNPKLFLSVAINFPQYKASLGATGDYRGRSRCLGSGNQTAGNREVDGKVQQAYPDRRPSTGSPWPTLT